ncbi:Bug family tripartite tricarboxylate transporter substrate binding protein [Achromobacter aloeverae]|uniref:LacI family transcriptional regulator n=1 Tax=Achromobacter aloeverae TaxID=1750518 RepID=A0A4Q1HDJ4_9BURK|nr:tripartite tricarboxylate transporter substrate binding protein [Achromobacter aloeverae]RXN83844.1 LacI family transcriptional regulator [Achromobacter aloeverae]
MVLRTAWAAVVAACMVLAAVAPAPALAADWPQRPVTLVVPFPPGGPTDLVARVLARQLTEQIGQTIVVENRGGANGNIGMQHVAQAAADGYTLLYNTSSIALSPNLYARLGFDPQRDFQAVTSTAVIPLVLLVHPSVPAKDMSSFIAYAKAQGGKLSYASASTGNVTHLGALMLLRAVGAQAMHVPYRGSAPAMTDLVGGQVQFMTNTLNDSLAFIRDGKLRALAVTGSTRSPLLPEVPTVAETAVPGFEVGAWQGIVVPKGTPPDIVARLNREVLKALGTEAVRKQLTAQGAQALGSTPQAYQRYIADETRRWGEVIREAGVKLDSP